MSNTFIKTAQAYLTKQFGANYVSATIKGTSGVQDAHEAIRPTDISLTPEKAQAKFGFDGIVLKLYRLIYNRTAKALMTQPVRATRQYILSNNGHTFKMSSSKVVFDGYLKVVGYAKSKELPFYKQGEAILVEKYLKEEKETKPPARFNEGSLIEKLDEIKVGRPSTFATTIKKIKDREYVDKEGQTIKPTEFGKIVMDKLITHFPEIINETYTATIEQELDDIAEDTRDYKKTMLDFYNKFDSTIEVASQTMQITRLLPVPVGEDCPEDGGVLIYKRSRVGDKFIACGN
jgi:DNA topoisomerase-1